MPNPFYSPKRLDRFQAVLIPALAWFIALLFIKFYPCGCFPHVSWLVVFLPVIIPAVVVLLGVLIMLIAGFFMNIFNKH